MLKQERNMKHSEPKFRVLFSGGESSKESEMIKEVTIDTKV